MAETRDVRENAAISAKWPNPLPLLSPHHAGTSPVSAGAWPHRRRANSVLLIPACRPASQPSFRAPRSAARTRLAYAFADASAAVFTEVRLDAPYVDRTIVCNGGSSFTIVNGLAGRDR